MKCATVTDGFLQAIIACPSSLVKNWANELIKWLGGDKVRPYACDNKGTKEQTTKDLEQFVASKGRSVVHPGILLLVFVSGVKYKVNPMTILSCSADRIV